MVFQNEIRPFFGYHDCWRIGVAGRDTRHHGRVDDPEPGDPAHGEAVVDDRQIVVSHLARADRVKNG